MSTSSTTTEAHISDSNTVADDGLFVVPAQFYSERLAQIQANITAYTEMMMLAPIDSEEAHALIAELIRLTHVEDRLTVILWRVF